MKRTVKQTIATVMSMVMGASVLIGSNLTTSEASVERKLPSNPVYDETTDMTDWDYVYFGTYPQTELSEAAVTEAIKSATYDIYGDAEIDGEKYHRVSAKTANYSYGVPAEGFYSWYGKGYVYYKYEPIKWRVLENDGKSLFLMADTALDCRKYSVHDGNVNWSTSYVRNWLNGNGPYAEGKVAFINKAFTEEEKSAILTTKVDKSDNPLHGTGGGSTTQDKIFLMSIREMVNEKYGFSSDFMKYSSTRRLEPTDYARAMGIWMSSYNEQYGDYCWWLLRSTGSHTKAVSLVYRMGNVYQDGYYADTPYYGICPALKVDIDSTAWTLVEDATEEAQAASYLNGADSVMPGDADGDGTVTLTDAQLALKLALKIVANDGSMNSCDVTGEGQISLEDAQYILKYALKIIDKFPCQELPAPTATPGIPTEPAVSEEPQQSEAPTTPPTATPTTPGRPTLPPSETFTPPPVVSDEPLVQVSQEPSGRIWIAGDSIAVSYNKTGDRDLCGWGEVIGDYFNDSFVVVNKAIGGRSAKSFTTENNYDDIIYGMEKGDYLFISFGHNDERAAVELYTDPYGDSSTERSYKWYLKEYYIDPAIRAGVQPVLVSSIVRRYFYDGKLINPQLHTPYKTAMEELVQEYAEMGITIHYIDLHSKMMNLYEQLGKDGTEKLHAKGDTTHLCRAGINIVCDEMVSQMKKQNMSIIRFLK